MNMKSFHIVSPQQLTELGSFAKEAERIMPIRSVWNIARRKKKKTPWDHAIFARFYSYGTTRKAVIVRKSTDDSTTLIAELKYNPALNWCKEHLQLEG